MRKQLLILALVVCFVPTAGSAVVINEWVSNDTSTDDYEFIELCGTPLESLDGLSVALIEGEGTGKGTVDRIVDLTGYSIGAGGYFVIGDPNVSPDIEMSPGFIENGGNTIVLVDGITVGTGTDIDTDDDCIEDMSIGTVIDAVGYGYGYSGDDCATYYGAVALGPDGTYDPAGGARCCDCTGEWGLVCMAATEPGGTACSAPDYVVAWATPGAANDCFDPTATDNPSWTGVKAMYK